ncbi:hypothetical protein [Dongia deserti]|uniref:hypothetical protein n=1 Tax=Dongia deserti TaxID=2268030 RepID=UPI000E648191|nr:hypothetical protein [Dongia deserti]
MLQLRLDPGKVAPNFEWTNRMRTLTSIGLAALLAGCSLFSTTTSWTKPGVTPEQAEADLDSCKRVARSHEKTDADIEQDRSVVLDDTQGAIDTGVSQDITRHRSRQRFDEFVDDCMRQLGYSPVQ